MLRLFLKIQRAHAVSHFREVGWEQADIVADEQRRGREARHYLDKDIRTVVIEEYIVAVQTLSEKIHGNLYIVSNRTDRVRILRYNINLPEPDARLCGEIQCDTVLLSDG